MSDLAALQEGFWAAAFGPPGEARAAAARVLSPEGRLGAAETAAVYRETCLVRDLGELAAAFPLLRRALGAHAFEDTCRAFLGDVGGRRSALARLGEELPAFLERGGRPRAWVDVAALEDMRAAALAAPDVAPAAAAALAALPDAGRARLAFVPALSRRPVVSDLATLADAPERMPRLVGAPAEPAELVVWRAGLDVVHARLTGPAAEALALAMAGATLDVVCGAFAAEPAPTEAAGQAVGAWFADAWVARVG